MNATPSPDIPKSILKWALIGIVGLLALVSLLAFGSVFFPFYPGYLLELLIEKYFAAISPLTMKIVSATAIDIWLARALAFTFLVALPPLLLTEAAMWLLRPIRLLSRRGRILGFLIIWLICISMSFLSRNVYFSQDGRPLQKYYRHDDGRIEFFPSELGVHPKYGEQLNFVTPEVTKESELTDQGISVIKVTSSPLNADVYFNWELIGVTPLTFSGRNIQGLMVVDLKGYSPQYRELSSPVNRFLSFDLHQEPIRPSKNFLILVNQDFDNPDMQSILKSTFLQHGLTVAENDNEQEFKNGLAVVRKTTNQALLAWVRARFAADLLLTVRVNLRSEDLSSIDVGYASIRESLTGIYSVDATTEAQVVETSSGKMLLSFPSRATSKSTDKLRSIRDVLSEVSAQIVRRIKREVL